MPAQAFQSRTRGVNCDQGPEVSSDAHEVGALGQKVRPFERCKGHPSARTHDAMMATSARLPTQIFLALFTLAAFYSHWAGNIAFPRECLSQT